MVIVGHSWTRVVGTEVRREVPVCVYSSAALVVEITIIAALNVFGCQSASHVSCLC